MAQVAEWIDRGVAAAAKGDEETLAVIRTEVAELMAAYPAPGLPIGA